MLIEIHCRHCGQTSYDVPLTWKLSDGCPACGSTSVTWYTDESGDPPDGFEDEKLEEEGE